MNQGKWIKVYNGIGYPMPDEDCKIWIARGSVFGEGWIQQVDYFVEQGYIEWDGTWAYQIATGEKPEPYVMEFAGNKKIVCECKCPFYKNMYGVYACHASSYQECPKEFENDCKTACEAYDIE